MELSNNKNKSIFEIVSSKTLKEEQDSESTISVIPHKDRFKDTLIGYDNQTIAKLFGYKQPTNQAVLAHYEKLPATIESNDILKRLLGLERETSEISATIKDNFKVTSVSTQVATIQNSVSTIDEKWRNLVAPKSFLDSYSSMAVKQQIQIQKDLNVRDDKSALWRKDLLNVTSKFVNRQVAWTNSLAIQLQDELDKPTQLSTDFNINVAEIPKYMGASKRDGVDVEVAFNKLLLNTVTEKGKKLVENIIYVKKLCETNKKYSLFANISDAFDYYVILARFYANTNSDLAKIIETLDLLFGSQYKGIANLLGVTNIDCLDEISELNNSGINFDVKGNKAKIQNRLYDRILELENEIITKLLNITSGNKEEFDQSFIDDNICMDIMGAMVRIQLNRTYYGASENKINDGLRDIISANYNVKDQSRIGISESGNDAGEADLLLCNRSDKQQFPIAIVEGIKLSCLEKNRLKAHIDKVLVNYNPCGCRSVFLIIYYFNTNLDNFWDKLVDYITDTYEFPIEYAVKAKPSTLPLFYTNSRQGKVELERNGCSVWFHFMVFGIQNT